MRRLDAIALEEGVDGGLLTAEALIEGHGVLGAALGEDAVAEAAGRGTVEDAVVLEYAEGVGLEHFGPLIAVVAGRIAARHDVGELYGHTGVGELRHDDGVFPGLLLKLHQVAGERLALGVVSHVEQSEAHLPQAGVGNVEVAAARDAVDELIGNGLARLIVEGESAEEVALDGVVLHELRGHLDEVPPDIGA